MSDLVMRPMREGDLAAVGIIEGDAYDFPWSESIFRDCMRARYACLVAEANTLQLGHAVMSMAAGEAHILNLCVRSESQGQGWGRQILEHLMELAYASGVDTVFLEVRPSNPVALALYHRSGFNQIGVRQDYYPSHDGREDALVLARAFATGSAFSQRK